MKYKFSLITGWLTAIVITGLFVFQNNRAIAWQQRMTHNAYWVGCLRSKLETLDSKRKDFKSKDTMKHCNDEADAFTNYVWSKK